MSIDNNPIVLYISLMIPEVLENLGLSTEEVEVYLSLLEAGAQSASDLAKTTKVKRTHIYNIARSLMKRGFVSQDQSSGTTKFVPLTPDKLLSLAHDKKDEAARLESSLETVLPDLKHKYKLIEAKPTIQTLEGIEGLKKLYKDILETKKDILLFRSSFDERNDIAGIVSEQIERQIKLGIHTRTITPLSPTTKDTFENFDKIRLVDRHILKSQDFVLPSQIIVYDSKVAITTLKSDILITIIDNKEISDTFKKLFEMNWNLTEAEHNSIVMNWRQSDTD